ncbi:MBL fold metallo-hydrolase [Paenibacillus solisilvae]|uniref:MBL fold metallo-hydrolase n=1 Tax=Paenibacillus solisilvae TaxID=2486751 RepID=A0ABW0VT22_9BACL
MRASDGVTMLSISATIMGKTDVIHPTLLWDRNNVILVDTAYPGQLPLVKAAVEQAGIRFEKLTAVILTHQDIDHIGNLPAIRKELPQVQILAHPIEKPYIQGEKMLVKITPESIEKAVAALPQQVPDEWRKAFRSTLENPPRASVDRTIAGGEELPYSAGLVVIDTPGHTPGHLSLYHQASKTLIAADALLISEGQLLLPEPGLCSDYELAKESIAKLASFDIESVICYHGGMITDNVKERIAKLISSF